MTTRIDSGENWYWDTGLPYEWLPSPGTDLGMSQIWDKGLPAEAMYPESETAHGGQIFQSIFDSVNSALRIGVLNPSAGNGTNLDFFQILEEIYDPSTRSIRAVTVA